MVPTARPKGMDFAIEHDQPDAACGFNLSDLVKELSAESPRKARSGSLGNCEEQLIIFASVERQLE